MNGYYSRQLSSNKLKACYDIAPPRVQQYLQAEIDYVIDNLDQSDILIELGCGYGRVLKSLLPNASKIIGIDTSRESLKFATKFIAHNSKCQFLQVNAVSIPLKNHSVDKVVCIQNGISAFKVDQLELIQESVRITRKGGICIFSSYSEKFWKERLDWFKLQSERGLLGKIDWVRTGQGVIFCDDGFRASTIGPEDFAKLVSHLNLEATINEIDNSSIFCLISV